MSPSTRLTAEENTEVSTLAARLTVPPRPLNSRSITLAMVSRQFTPSKRSVSQRESAKSSVCISHSATVLSAPGTSETISLTQAASSGSTSQSSRATMAAAVRKAQSRHTGRRLLTTAAEREAGK